jgi:hypothetical protein
MKFVVSERVRARTDIGTIICALFEQLAKVSARVHLTDEGHLIAKRIEPSFASIVRFDQTTIIVEPKEGGFLFVAEVNYRPSFTPTPPPPAQPHAKASAAQRLRCAPGMFNSLEVQVLYPT